MHGEVDNIFLIFRCIYNQSAAFVLTVTLYIQHTVEVLDLQTNPDAVGETVNLTQKVREIIIQIPLLVLMSYRYCSYICSSVHITGSFCFSYLHIR